MAGDAAIKIDQDTGTAWLRFFAGGAAPVTDPATATVAATVAGGMDFAAAIT